MWLQMCAFRTGSSVVTCRQEATKTTKIFTYPFLAIFIRKLVFVFQVFSWSFVGKQDTPPFSSESRILLPFPSFLLGPHPSGTASVIIWYSNQLLHKLLYRFTVSHGLSFNKFFFFLTHPTKALMCLDERIFLLISTFSESYSCFSLGMLA